MRARILNAEGDTESAPSLSVVSLSRQGRVGCDVTLVGPGDTSVMLQRVTRIITSVP